MTELDQVCWQIHCLLQEIYFLNDRLIQGDHTERSATKVAKGWAKDLEQRLNELPEVKEAWADAHCAYGGRICLSYCVTMQTGEIRKASLTPVRKG